MPEQKSNLENPIIVPLVIDRVEPQSHRELLSAAMRANAAAASEAVQEWRAWHHERGTAQKIRAMSKDIGACFPPELSRAMYARATATAPLLSALCVANTLKWLRRTTTEKKSSKYSGRMWRAILAGWENQPAFTFLPLRVYAQNAKLVLAERGETHKYQHVELVVRILRDPAGGLQETRLRIPHPREGASSDYKRYYTYLVEMVRGERKFCESQIVWHSGRLGLRLTVEREVEQVSLDPGRVLYLRAGKRCAWRARFGGQSISIYTDQLSEVRRAREKQISIRHKLAESAGGYKLARNHWQRFTRTFNRRIVADLERTIVARRVGTVVVMDGSPKCALAMVGVESAGEPTNFPTAQFREFLAQKLVPLGCEVVGRANFKSVKRRKERTRINLDKKALRTTAV